MEVNDIDTIDRKNAAARSTTRVVKKGMILPFQLLSISFEDINYFVDMPAEMKSQGVTDQSRLQSLLSQELSDLVI